MKLFILLAIIVLAYSISPEPVPTCSTPHITLKDFPISLQETQSFNANDIFRGYNLNYSLIGAPNFVFMRQKFKLYKTQAIPQPGLRSYHMQHQGNRWGNKLVTLSAVGNSSIVRWGISETLDAIPTVNQNATIQSDPKTHCFDAIWLQYAEVIMVDCVRQVKFGLQNIFLYVNSTSKLPMKEQVKNDMYVGFTRMTRRRVQYFQEDGEQYLVRAYFADSVDELSAHNTYLEIMLINNPLKPWTIKVMDRSYLNQDKLSITDFKIYLGDIYILDYHSGVISFDLTPSQNIVIKGRYRSESGFTKMGIYSSNMVNEVLLALANDHGVYEIDWTIQLKPVILSKYSILQGSKIVSLWVNQEYIATQIVANVTNGVNQTQQYHSTFIFDRGTRTYTNAYAVIAHPSYRAAVDMNMEHNMIMSIDEQSISTYQIDEPMIYLNPTNAADENKQFIFTIKAVSSNENNGHNLICSFDLKFRVVPVQSMEIFPTGFQVPNTYYANYPGEFGIPLNRYVHGSNVTWGVQEKVKNESLDLPSHWVLQQNDTKINWDKKQPLFFKITFLRKQQFEYAGKEYFFMYTQDVTNRTHITMCLSTPFSKNVNCTDDSHFKQINYKIDNLTATAFYPNYGQVLHLAAVLYEDYPNEVFIYNVGLKDMFSKPIIMGKDWEGQIQSIEFLGHYLAVVLRHIKTIVFYDMKVCHDHQQKQCQQVYRIDSRLMDKLGVVYFSPLEIYTSIFHPSVLFIQNVDSVIILDITPQGPILLDQISSTATTQPGFWKWKLAITRGHLMIINPPNEIQEYSLQQLYTRKITHMTKRLPTYDYLIPDRFDCDFSDTGDLLYITAIDKNLPSNQNSVILVYRSSQPAVTSFYDVFNINGKYDQILIDVTGSFADYVSVVTGSVLMMFRQYQVPILVFQNSFSDFEFNITFTNDPNLEFHYLARSKLVVSNFPQTIVINDSRLNQSDYLSSQVQYQNKYQEFILDDSTWFNGSVLNYTIEDCDVCGSKFRVVNHLEEKRDFYSQTDMQDYVFTPQGGVIQQFQSLIKMKHNGSIDQMVTFPSILDGESCMHIRHSWIYDYTLSACQHNGANYLYTTTYTSFKPFVNGPFYSGAKYVTGIHIMEDIMILIDVDENPWDLKRQGGIIVYAMNHNPFDPEMFDEIQIIQTDDLESATNWPGGPAFIGSAELIFTNETDIYRIAITELRHGIFFVDFKWSRGRKSIQIIKINFVDLNSLLISNNLHMPNMAFFSALTITQDYFNPIFKYSEIEIVVTTRNFHMFQFNFHFDKTGTILESKLGQIFYKYGFYETSNYIKQFDGYFAVVQTLPNIYQDFDWFSKQVLTVYDTKERWVLDSTTETIPDNFYEGTNVSASWIHGGMQFPRGRVTFDFNFTFTRNRTDPFRQIGLLAVHARQATIREIALNSFIKIVTEDGIDSDQTAKFKANSDFSSVSIQLSIIAGGLGGGAIVAIVIGCILVAVGGGYLVYRWNLKRKANITKDLEESLIDRDTLVTKNNEESSSEQDDDDQDEDQDQDQEQDQNKSAQQTQQKLAQSVTTPLQAEKVDQALAENVDETEVKSEQ